MTVKMEYDSKALVYEWFHQSFDELAILDSKLNFIDANDAFLSLSGFSIEELRQLALHELVTPAHCKELWNAVENLLQMSNLKNYTNLNIQLVQKVRSVVPRRVDIRCIRGTEGRISTFCLRFAKVEESNTIEEDRELWETKRFFKILSENAHDVISYTTADGVCQYVSPSTRGILGYEPREMIGTPTVNFYHPEDADYVAEIYTRLSRGDDIERFTSRVRCKNGSYRWFDTSLKVVRNEEGGLLQVVAVGRDVSEQMNLQESLEQAVRIAGLGHWDWDLGTNRVQTSDQMNRILGFEGNSHEYAFSSLVTLVHPEEQRLIEKSLKNALQTGSPFDRVFRIVRNDGCVRYLHGQGEVLLDEDGIARKMVGTVHDITTLRAFERKLEESEQRYEVLRLESEKVSEDRQLAAGIAHEIRNPLTALKGFTRLLHQKSPAPNSRYFDIMQMELNRIETILSEMLVIAKTPKRVFQPVQLTTLVSEVTRLMNPLATLQGVSVQTEVDDTVPAVSCDEGHLKQVLINVIKNAIEAMPDGGTLGVYVQSVKHGVSIQITDSGDGISEEKLQMIGEPFYTTKDNGTGLGLLVSRRLLETYGGELNISSEPGTGTTVTIHLPVSPNKIA